jgi:hypothetical protein
MLPGMKRGASLANNDVTRNDSLVCRRSVRVVRGQTSKEHAPENFFKPRRLPGEPPWLRTVPPARFVAVRTAPVALARQTCAFGGESA